jgi:hypothetical protein
MVFCDSALLSHHTTFEFHGGAPGHALHSGRYPKSKYDGVEELGAFTQIGAKWVTPRCAPRLSLMRGGAAEVGALSWPRTG